MNKTVSIALGVVLILGGGGFAAMNAGPFQEALKMYGDNGAEQMGIITEVKVSNGKSEVHFMFNLGYETLRGMSVIKSSQFTEDSVGARVPIVFAENDHSVSRLQEAEGEIFGLGRNVAIASLLTIAGLALALRRAPGTRPVRATEASMSSPK